MQTCSTVIAGGGQRARQKFLNNFQHPIKSCDVCTETLPRVFIFQAAWKMSSSSWAGIYLALHKTFLGFLPYRCQLQVVKVLAGSQRVNSGISRHRVWEDFGETKIQIPRRCFFTQCVLFLWNPILLPEQDENPKLSKLQGKIPTFLLRRVCRWLADINEVHSGDIFSKIAAPFLRNKVLALATASTYRPRTNAD